MENENLTESAQAENQESGVSGQIEKSEIRTQEPIVVTDEMLEKTRTALATMLDYLGLDGTVKAEARTSKINLLVASEDAGRIIGRKGQSLESLQVLLNRMMQKGDIPFPKVYIDIDGYSSSSKRGEKHAGERREDRHERHERRDRDDRRERGPRGDRRPPRGPRREQQGEFAPARQEEGGAGEEEFSEKDAQLRQQALDSSKEVRRWGESVTLPPMNAHDRRIIHITLEGETDIQTESLGDGNFKSVKITLKK